MAGNSRYMTSPNDAFRSCVRMDSKTVSPSLSIVLRTQHGFSDLAGRSGGQRIGNDNLTRHLVVSKTLSAERAQLVLTNLMARRGHNVIAPDFTEDRIGHAGTCGHGYGRVRGQHVFNLDRIHVVSALHEHLFSPTAQDKVT